MIARQITQARKDNIKIIHKKELERLQDLALKQVAKNFLLYPDLKGLTEDFKVQVKFFI